MVTPGKPINQGESATDERVDFLVGQDPLLEPYRSVLLRRARRTETLKREITGGNMDLAAFASGHEYFGLHLRDGRWVLREWAPNASTLHLKGPFSNWQAAPEYALMRAGDEGVWEIELPEQALHHMDPYRLEVSWPGGRGDRMPAWTRRVTRDDKEESFNAQVWRPPVHYEWRHQRPPRPSGPLLIYEAHVGMAQEEPKVGSYEEFRLNVLPRIRDAGYHAIQLMALAEHPYYASFGYQVSSFFACSSRFGTPDDLKALVDEAHGMGLLVFMDLVHSHAARNEVEGIARQDGSPSLYFHEGARGEHPAWASKCFDYGKPQVLHFLLSNCRFWMDEYRFDGFRFDGVTSMLYLDHGLARVFKGYEDYFADDIDEDALSYLTLANELVHSLDREAVTIAEDVSGFPALARAEGGAGFDYRFSMGVADHWIELTKDAPDERWSMGKLWYELTNRRRNEATISYAESHDQALVGDQTLIFRLMGTRMYDRMSAESQDPAVERGIALHKLIRLATLGTAGDGYLNFMGNELGHPEWIDFPREGNQWSYAFARRQWGLAEDPALRYRHLAAFDRALMGLARASGVPDGEDELLLVCDEDAKVLAWWRADMVFVLNFHPTRSHTDFQIPSAPGSYRAVLDTDLGAYGGFDRQDSEVVHFTRADPIKRHFLSLYLPSRTGLVLAPDG